MTDPLTSVDSTTVSHVIALCAAAADAPALTACLSAWTGSITAAVVVVVRAQGDHAAVAAILARLDPALTAEAVDGAAAAPGRIYLCPAQSTVRVVAGRLRLSRRDREIVGDPHIDVALSLLAEDQGTGAIAVLFAGAVSDAFGGTYAVKEVGGMVMVQDENAKSAGARSEVALLADYVLPAKSLLMELQGYVEHHRRMRKARKVAPEVDDDGVERVVSIIGSHTGVDFRDYQKTTLLRRIQRRMSVHRAASMVAYIDLLQQSPHEVIVLYREMLIGVTRFFRDEHAFVALRARVIPQLLARAGAQEPIRVWVAGCATGEEAYSIAMSIQDGLEDLGTHAEIKVFATDLDREAVEFASAGVYPASVVADIPPHLLERFFTRTGDSGYQIAKHIREMLVFAPHNILKDPPFYKIDLVTCRNLLIYLQPALQRKVLSSFHFALKSEGFLMLGMSESLGDLASYFSAVEGKWRLYQKTPGLRAPPPSDELFHEVHRFRPSPQRPGHPTAAAAAGDSLQEVINQSLLREFLPAFLVNEPCEVLHESLRLLSLVAECMTSIAMVTGADGSIRYVNRRFVEISGWSADEVIGGNPRLLKSPDADPRQAAELWAAITTGNRWQGRFVNRTKSGATFCEDAVIIPVLGRDGMVANYLKLSQVVPGP
ncbi:MAG: PAS domain S-box protein [Planctomycetes bacterium]|nr:PAS domain S-box protein [Planctomycetota bacterium]